MADAYEVLIANAVVAELNDQSRSWAGQFTAAGPWMKVYTPEDLANLQCFVAPLRLATAKAARGVRRCDYVIGLAFKKLVDPDDTAGINAVTKTVQDVHDWFDDNHRLATLPEGIVMQADRPDIYDVDLLYEQRAFDTIIEVTVSLTR